MRWGKPVLIGMALAITLSAGGCGGSGPRPVQVKGRVTLDGQPLPGGTVTFFPEDVGGHQATAVTDSDGSFSLTTFSTGDGAIPGQYKILVKYQEASSEEEMQPNMAKPDIKAMMEKSAKLQREKAKRLPKYAVPAQYGNPSKTPLKQRVPPESHPVEVAFTSK